MTTHRRREAIKSRQQSGPVREIARRTTISHSTISLLNA
jgi:hypothetical protein